MFRAAFLLENRRVTDGAQIGQPAHRTLHLGL